MNKTYIKGLVIGWMLGLVGEILLIVSQLGHDQASQVIIAGAGGILIGLIPIICTYFGAMSTWDFINHHD